jgi:hypothetical protein
MRFKIWNNETKSYVSYSAPGTHCFSEFAVRESGEIIEIITELSTGQISIQENQSYYWRGTEIVNEKKYEIHSSFSEILK